MLESRFSQQQYHHRHHRDWQITPTGHVTKQKYLGISRHHHIIYLTITVSLQIEKHSLARFLVDLRFERLWPDRVKVTIPSFPIVHLSNCRSVGHLLCGHCIRQKETNRVVRHRYCIIHSPPRQFALFAARVCPASHQPV